MGILKRLADIVSANINWLIDRLEPPERMIDQYLRNLESDLGRVKAETAKVMATKKKAEARLKASEEEMKKWLGYAKAAADAGNDDDAKVFVRELIKIEDKVADQAYILQVAAENCNKMLAMHDELMDEISRLRDQKDTLMAKYSVAKTAAYVKGFNSSMSGSVRENLKGYNRMKDKLEDAFLELEAMEQLETRGTDISGMFSGCGPLTNFDVSKFNTSKGINFNYLFGGCSGLDGFDASTFDTSNQQSGDALKKAMEKYSISSSEDDRISKKLAEIKAG